MLQFHRKDYSPVYSRHAEKNTKNIYKNSFGLFSDQNYPTTDIMTYT